MRARIIWRELHNAVHPKSGVFYDNIKSKKDSMLWYVMLVLF